VELPVNTSFNVAGPSRRHRSRRSTRCAARKASTSCCRWVATARCLRPGTAANATAGDSRAGTPRGSRAKPARVCTHRSRLVSQLDSCPLSGVLQTQIRHRLRSEVPQTEVAGYQA
jgi:hypothetical protein